MRRRRRRSAAGVPDARRQHKQLITMNEAPKLEHIDPGRTMQAGAPAPTPTLAAENSTWPGVALEGTRQAGSLARDVYADYREDSRARPRPRRPRASVVAIIALVIAIVSLFGLGGAITWHQSGTANYAAQRAEDRRESRALRNAVWALVYEVAAHHPEAERVKHQLAREEAP